MMCLADMAWAGAQIAPARLRCEYRENPLGIDAAKPRLSWICESSQRGQRQTGYRILVASSPELLSEDAGDLWDSGRVPSEQSVHVEYAGDPLASRQTCFWKVRVWDMNDSASDWSAASLWTMGLLQEPDWQAQWICPEAETPVGANELTILKAMYVAKDGTASVDVTEHVRKQVNKNNPKIQVHPDNLGGRRIIKKKKE